MSKSRKPVAARVSIAKRRKPEVIEVASSEFAGRFGHWSMKAQREPIGVVNNKTGATVGYFVSEEDFVQYLRIRDALPKARWAWEMDDEMVAELKKPLPRDYK